MTIGDEKVVRYEPRMIGIEDRQYEAGMYADLHGHYVLHSAYAELAADRDLWRSMATFEGKVSASVLDDLHTTQAQLAELRGRCEALSTDISEAVEDVARSGGYINSDEAKGWSVELRTLAAADGGGG